MTQSNSDFYTFEYFDGQLRNSHPALLAEFDILNGEAAERLHCEIDVVYGPDPRQRLDIFLGQGPCKGSILYFHAGYWQARDKSDFRFLAERFVGRGFNFVLANYPLCPNVTLDTLVDQAAASIPFLLDYLADKHPAGTGLVVAGHSAGGHLAVEMALRRWPNTIFGGRPIHKIVPISGIYDLAPLILTPLNVKLRLGEEEARANSPILRSENVGIPATFIVGGGETSEFRRQSYAMSEAWKAAGNHASYIEVVARDHFSVLPVIASMDDPVIAAAFIP